MSQVSSASSGQSSKVTGIPRRCWCGAAVVTKLSKSEANPYRRYYRCSIAASNKLVDDSHIFKWVDEAFSNEIETFRNTFGRVENEVKELGAYLEDHHKLVMGLTMARVEKEVKELGIYMEEHKKVVMEKIDQEVAVRVEAAIGDAKRMMKATMIGLIVAVVSVGVMKFA